MKTENQTYHRGVRSVSGPINLFVKVCYITVISNLMVIGSITHATKASCAQGGMCRLQIVFGCVSYVGLVTLFLVQCLERCVLGNFIRVV